MKPISDNRVIQIEITNGCTLACANCTRHVGHHRKPFMMSPEFFEKAVQSLEGFPGRVGIMGGEPSMHPKFPELMAIYRKNVEKDRREFWTTGWKWTEYHDLLMETFHPHLIHYNDHTQSTGLHQPLLVAIEEVIEDKVLREELIDDCWVQKQWSASITPKGAFFCEVAASLHHLFDGPDGWPVEKGWWKRVPPYGQQRDFACNKCSAAIPMERYSDARGGRDISIDVISEGNKRRLVALGSPKVARGHYRIYDQKLVRDDVEAVKDWTPSKFRDFVAHNPEDVKKAV